MNQKLLFIISILFCLFAFAWRFTNGFSTLDFGLSYRTTDTGDIVADVKAGDPEMEYAMKKGKETLETFIEEYKKFPHMYASVKVQFTENAKTEYIWCEPIFVGEKVSEVKISNDPIDVHNIQFGDIVRVPTSDIVDWIYIKENKRFGGFTFDVIKSRESKERGELYEQAWLEVAQEFYDSKSKK